jgi:succinyl-CoA synthetase alpha subunit
VSILADKNTRVIVQGMTGREASAFTKDMLEYGTRVVAGITPGKGGATLHGLPIYDTVDRALRDHPADASVVSVPAAVAKNAVLEALENGIRLIVVVTERIPRQDTVAFLEAARQCGATIIGPNSLGLISPGAIKLGMAGGPVRNATNAFTPGDVGVISRSGGMTTEIANLLTMHGVGQSTCVSIGGDPIVGTNALDLIPLFDADDGTRATVLFCEPGGSVEERLAERVARNGLVKPIVAYIAGRFADRIPGVRFGHAGVIVNGTSGSVAGKISAFQNAGIMVANTLSEIVDLLGGSLPAGAIAAKGRPPGAGS